ncbi:hypothetical protein H4219_005126 [Mycoemilia scoparia]|uniref:Uncharacterized protein n=1 Tax=Mycoemilia scoparia TaxID=417184 RepID=A0A9W8DQ50_9FUNG|nr:hypothetical protein H4219_005126 [Mycoemilia scoparia]
MFSSNFGGGGGGGFQHFSWSSRLYDPTCPECNRERDCGRVPEHHKHGDCRSSESYSRESGSETRYSASASSGSHHHHRHHDDGVKLSVCIRCSKGCPCHFNTACHCHPSECQCECTTSHHLRRESESYSRKSEASSHTHKEYPFQNVSMDFRNSMMSGGNGWSRHNDSFYAPFRPSPHRQSFAGARVDHYGGGATVVEKQCVPDGRVQTVDCGNDVRVHVTAEIVSDSDSSCRGRRERRRHERTKIHCSPSPPPRRYHSPPPPKPYYEEDKYTEKVKVKVKDNEWELKDHHDHHYSGEKVKVKVKEDEWELNQRRDHCSKEKVNIKVKEEWEIKTDEERRRDEERESRKSVTEQFGGKVKPLPQPRGCSALCRIFCSGLCSIPYNQNSRFNRTNFRIWPDYDFIPDDALIPRNTELFLIHTLSATSKKFVLTIPDIMKEAKRVYVDIIHGHLVVHGTFLELPEGEGLPAHRHRSSMDSSSSSSSSSDYSSSSDEGDYHHHRRHHHHRKSKHHHKKSMRADKDMYEDVAEYDSMKFSKRFKISKKMLNFNRTFVEINKRGALVVTIPAADKE